MKDVLIPRIARDVFDRRLIQNNLRAIYVEHMVAEILGPDWRLMEGWSPWDLHRPRDDAKLEVKQSAARQSWHRPDEFVALPNPSFDIAARSHRWIDNSYREQPGRAADVYVFAWHPVTDANTCDHRDPGQWRFLVARADALPAQAKITLSRLRSLTSEAGTTELPATVDAAMKNVPAT